MRRKHPVAIELDNMIESLISTCEQLIEKFDDVELSATERPIIDRLEEQIKQLRRRWLAEQTARAILK